MTRYRADMEIQADLALQNGLESLSFKVPGPNVEIVLRNGPIGQSQQPEFIVGEV